jgi:hypothetical protein
MKRILLLGLTGLLAVSAGFAQEFRGSIGGTISDATGAVMAGVKITVTEINTGTKVESNSDAAGHYNVPFLLPGDYDIAASMAGFKEALRKGMHLGAGETPTVDIRMEVGASQTAVEVTDVAPLVNSENASIGSAISTKEIEDLPSNGGTPMMVAQFAMGVTPMSQPSQVLPYTSGGAASWSISGSANQTNELLVDGVPNGTWDGRLAYSPPQDAVQEVRVKAFDSDASYGHTGGGTANQILKSGTNELKGAAMWKNQPNNLVANDFFRNKSGLPVQLTHLNQYSIVGGGPLFVPKVFNGKNRVFWFFAFDGLKDSQPATTFMTVPTAAERTGDFSALLNVKSPTVLYDPYSATQSGSTITRTPYVGNIIPSSQLSAIAKNYLALFPAANVVNGARDDGYNNYGSNAPSADGYTNELGRMDINVTQNQRTYFNVRHTDYYQNKNDYFHNLATGSNLSRSNWGGTLDHVWVINPSNVLDIRANFTRMYEDHSSPSAGFDPTTYGFPSYLGGSSQYTQLPTMAFASNSGLQQLGFGGNANILPSQSLQLFGSLVMTRGAHNIKVGGDLRQYRLNYRSYGSSAGNFSFSANNWVRQASNSSSTVAMGQDLAEFLLGLPTSGTYDLNASAMYYSYYGAAFVHDDWRVSRNLSLNLGVRFDHDFPYHEKWGRTVDGFAYDAANPLQAAAQAAYAKSPSALLPASQFMVPGGLTFASSGNTAIYENTSHLVSPRIGLAWTPERFHNKLAIRSGFAMFVQPISISVLQPTGAYSTSPLSLQPGFSQTTQMVVTNNNNLSPANTLSNPFPGGAFTQPVGSAAGLLTNAGQSVTFMNPEMKSPYSVRWNLSIQYQLTPNLVTEVAYIGNHSIHLPMTYTQLNGVPAQYLSTSPFRDQNVITALSATIANPFLGLQTSTGTASTISVAQLLAPYPEFPQGQSSPGSSGVVMNDNSVGSSYYDSLNVRAQQRVSRGMTLIGSFMWSKMIDANDWLNATDLAPEHRISPFYRPMRFSIASTYTLPIGRGKLVDLHSRALNTLIGGWLVAGTYQYQVGGPLIWMNGSTNNPGDYIYMGGDLNSQPRNVDGNAFDTTRFDTKSADQYQYHIRTFASTFGNVRSDGINEFSASIQKRFEFAEKRAFQIRAEAFNLMNHPVFAAANTAATNSAFGTISSMANKPRSIQLVARFQF